MFVLYIEAGSLVALFTNNVGLLSTQSTNLTVALMYANDTLLYAHEKETTVALSLKKNNNSDLTLKL